MHACALTHNPVVPAQPPFHAIRTLLNRMGAPGNSPGEAAALDAQMKGTYTNKEENKLRHARSALRVPPGPLGGCTVVGILVF